MMYAQSKPLRVTAAALLALCVTTTAANANPITTESAAVMLGGSWPAAGQVTLQLPETATGPFGLRPRATFDGALLAGTLRSTVGADLRLLRADFGDLVGLKRGHVDFIVRAQGGTLGFVDPGALFAFTTDGALIAALAVWQLRVAAGPTLTLDASFADGGRIAPGGTLGVGASIYGVELWLHGDAVVSWTTKTSWRPRGEVGATAVVPFHLW